MEYNCIVPGCSSRSDKKECKGIKFYRLPTARKTLERWLLLIGCKISEVYTVEYAARILLVAGRRYCNFFLGKNIRLL